MKTKMRHRIAAFLVAVVLILSLAAAECYDSDTPGSGNSSVNEFIDNVGSAVKDIIGKVAKIIRDEN